MTAPRRVVVVYSRVGGGHLSAARALAEELEATGEATTTDRRRVPGVRTGSRDAVPGGVCPAGAALSAAVVDGLPRLATGLDPKRILGPFLRRGFRRLMAEERPDLVVSVLPGVNGLLAEAAAYVDARLEVVLTDWHSVHRFWVAPGVSYYTTPTDSARQDCIRFGAPDSEVEVVGIPVRRAFGANLDRAMLRERCLTELGLDPRRFTVLAMVGAEGSPRALKNIARLAQLDRDLQMLVICGRNAELRRHVEQLQTRTPLLAVGFVDNVAELMRAADVLVTKAGGLTLAEAFCCGVPIVVHDVLAGQEAGNLEYVLQRQAVEYARSPVALSPADRRSCTTIRAASRRAGGTRRAAGASAGRAEIAREPSRRRMALENS